MKRKIIKDELYKMDAIDIYKLVLRGDLNKFPRGFWSNDNSVEDNAIKCIKWLIEERLKLTDEELKKNLSKKIFHKNCLTGMLLIRFNDSPYKAINAAYPNKFKEWEFKHTSSGFWTVDNGIRATKWLIEEKLKLTDEALKEQLSVKMFVSNYLGGMLNICFKGSPYLAINNVYPGKFKEWEFKVVPKNFWDISNGIKATKWLIEEKLKFTDDELKKKISAKVFCDNNLGGMLRNCFNGSPYLAINSVYPNKFKEWEFKISPMGYWRDVSNGIEATRWLVDEKLKLKDEELKEQLSMQMFKDNNLIGMLDVCFKGSPYLAINSAYPGKFKEWEFKNIPNGFWNDKSRGIDAVKWLVEDKLNLSEEELKSCLSEALFVNNGLRGMLAICFNNSPYLAINSAYPGKFKEWEFKNVPRHYWKEKENAIKAVKWLVEEKLNLSDEDIKDKVCTELFKKNNLTSMLQYGFGGSPYLAINSVYPGKFKPTDMKCKSKTIK
ncbi:DUF4046 domain-containing protein [Clostridium perfringens]